MPSTRQRTLPVPPPPDGTPQNTPETATILTPDAQMEQAPVPLGGATYRGALEVVYGLVGRFEHRAVLYAGEIAEFGQERLDELIEIGALRDHSTAERERAQAAAELRPPPAEDTPRAATNDHRSGQPAGG